MAAPNSPLRDEGGKALTDYPRPSIAVDIAVLTVAWDQLWVLLVHTPTGEERLPGTFLHEGETLERAVRRALKVKAGVPANNPQQFHVFDDPGRDDRGWVLSVAFMDAIRDDLIPRSERTRLVPVDKVPRLSYDHNEIINAAVERLREDYRVRPDPWHLLPDTAEGVLVRDLWTLHNAVAGGMDISQDTFRRRMLGAGLEGTGERRSEGPGKPAQVFAISASPPESAPRSRPRRTPRTR